MTTFSQEMKDIIQTNNSKNKKKFEKSLPRKKKSENRRKQRTLKKCKKEIKNYAKRNERVIEIFYSADKITKFDRRFYPQRRDYIRLKWHQIPTIIDFVIESLEREGFDVEKDIHQFRVGSLDCPKSFNRNKGRFRGYDIDSIIVSF